MSIIERLIPEISQFSQEWREFFNLLYIITSNVVILICIFFDILINECRK